MAEKSIKTITFSGTKEGYHMWEFQMRAFLRELGCTEALSRADLEAEVSDRLMRKKNDTAYARIAIAIMSDDSVSAELIKRSVSQVYPEGDAALVWQALVDRYEPKNAVDQQTLMTELFASTLENGSKDPEVWIVELQSMQTKLNAMGATVSDNMVIGHILSRLPTEYDQVADNLASQENKTIASVSSILKDKYERLKKAGKFLSTEETVLVGYKKFSGDCRYCGKKGHKAAECFKKRDDLKNKYDGAKNKRGFKGECLHCGKKGHKKAECYKLKNRNEVDERGAVVLMAEMLDHEESMMLHQVIKYVLDTKNRGIRVKPNQENRCIAYVDSDYTGDRESRRSITGYLIHLFGVPIAWKSRQQGGGTLSSSEAECYAISEVAKEMKFVKMILVFLEIDTGELMKIHVDNIGAIHLSNKAASGLRTKHIDTRLHYVKELTQGEQKILEIEFVRSEDNQSDTFTKNTSQEVFQRHTSKYMMDDG
jgi:hypothetical protein